MKKSRICAPSAGRLGAPVPSASAKVGARSRIGSLSRACIPRILGPEKRSHGAQCDAVEAEPRPSLRRTEGKARRSSPVRAERVGEQLAVVLRGHQPVANAAN